MSQLAPTSNLKIELNVCLLPEAALNTNLVAVSDKEARKRPDCLVVLQDGFNRLTLAPHLTLYQVALHVQDLPVVCNDLRLLASEFSSIPVVASEVAYNDHEGSLEVRYASTGSLMELQLGVIGLLNPRRGSLLLEKDPAGNLPSIENPNVAFCGFPEVGDTFRPHATLNWFPVGTSVGEDELRTIDLVKLSGFYDTLAVCVLGPHGTCPQKLATFPLK